MQGEDDNLSGNDGQEAGNGEEKTGADGDGCPQERADYR